MENRLWTQLFSPKPTKGELTRLQIAEAAVQIYATHGVENVTYERVAKASKISRPLVIRYFPSYRDLFNFCAKYVRAQLQEMIVAKLEKETSRKGKLEAYFSVHFDWIRAYPLHAKFWLLFLYYCGIDEDYRELNGQFVKVGTERIALLLSEGKTPTTKQYHHARRIQLFLSACLTAPVVETTGKTNEMYALVLKFAEECL